MVAIAANEAQPIADSIREDKDNKYEYQINKNQAIGVFKDCYIEALLMDNRFKCARECAKIISLVAQSVVPVRPDRSVLKKQDTA